jgi:hypothetical protein
MNEKVEVNVQYSVDDYVRGCVFIRNRGSLFYKYEFWVINFMSFVGFAVFYLVFTKTENEWNASDFTNLLFVLMIALPVCYLLNNLYLFTEKSLRKQYESSPLLREESKIFFSADGIETESASLTNKLSWSAITETDETDEDFFFFTSPKMALFIPKRTFTFEQQDKIRNLTKIKLGENARILAEVFPQV